jgi:hypothetical protein
MTSRSEAADAARFRALLNHSWEFGAKCFDKNNQPRQLRIVAKSSVITSEHVQDKMRDLFDGFMTTVPKEPT